MCNETESIVVFIKYMYQTRYGDMNVSFQKESLSFVNKWPPSLLPFPSHDDVLWFPTPLIPLFSITQARNNLKSEI